MRWLDSLRDTMGINLSKLREIMKDRGAWYAAVHSVRKSLTWLAAEQHKLSFKYIRGSGWCRWLLKPLLPGMSPTRSSHLKLHIRITWGAFCKQVLMSRGFPCWLTWQICQQYGTWAPSLGREDPLEKGKATHSTILAWRISWIV